MNMNNLTTLTTKVLIIFCLATASGLAGADDRNFSRNGYTPIDKFESTLGNFRGANRGYEILYRDSSRRRWQLAPGAATAIGDGWVLGTDRHRGGFGIYRWNGRDWSRMPGTAVRIGGSYQQPWVINELGVQYTWNGYDWRQQPVSRSYGRDNYERSFRQDDQRGRDQDNDRDDRDNDRDRRDNDRRDRDYR